jgi:hypothetical protein
MATTESELKKLKPVTAYAMVLCSHANCRLLFKRFKEVCKQGDEKMSEMLVSLECSARLGVAGDSTRVHRHAWSNVTPLSGQGSSFATGGAPCLFHAKCMAASQPT